MALAQSETERHRGLEGVGLVVKAIQPPKEIQELIDTFRNMGGVVDYSLIEWEDELPPTYVQHKWAAIFILSIYEKQIKERAAILLQSLPKFTTKEMFLRFIGISRKFSHQEQVALTNERQLKRRVSQPFFCDLSLLHGKQIGLEDFLGPNFNPRVTELISERHPFGLQGYCYAFASPPYGVHAYNEVTVDEVFLALNKYLFSDFTVPLEIYEWSTNWHEYFVEGQDWWGSFLWTVYNPQQKFIAVITASTTD